MLPKFYKIISLKKKKKLYEIEASNTASLHKIFESLEVTTGDFCGVLGTPANSRGWGCDRIPWTCISVRSLNQCLMNINHKCINEDNQP